MTAEIWYNMRGGMHRLLVDSATLDAVRADLSREGAAHLRVLRPKDGEEFELFDGRGAMRTYRWDARGKALSAAGRLRRAEPKRGGASLILFACVTKGQRWDWTLQKATELGVDRIVPVVSARTVVRVAFDERDAKRERWRRICEEAARQSDAAWLPEISEPVDFGAALAEAAKTVCFAGALTTPPPEPLLAAAMRELAKGGADAYSVFVGPEGDFSPEELAALLAVAIPANFGPTILRAETAAIYAVSVLAAAMSAAAPQPSSTPKEHDQP